MSFCRSLTMDNWSEANLLSMLLGGNRQLKAFFTRQRIANSTVDVLYRSRPAAYYREQLAKQVDQLLKKRHRQQLQLNEEQDEVDHEDEVIPRSPRERGKKKKKNKNPRKQQQHHQDDDDDDDDQSEEAASGVVENATTTSSEEDEEEDEDEEEESPPSASVVERAQSAPSAVARPRKRPEMRDFDAEIVDAELGASLTRALPPPGWSCPGKSMALVTKVRSTGAAARAGVRVGDYVVGMNGRAVNDYDEFVSLFPRTPRPTRLTIRRFQSRIVIDDDHEEKPHLTVDFGVDDAPLGFSIERDKWGRARVSRVAPGGRAAGLGVKVDDVLMTLNTRETATYDLVVDTLPLLAKPIVVGLQRPPEPRSPTTPRTHQFRHHRRPPLASRAPSSRTAGSLGTLPLHDDSDDDDTFGGTTKKVLDAFADDREFDVIFRDGPLGMRIEERIGLVPVTVVTHVDPKGQAFQAGVRPGCTVQGLNGEKYLSHAHCAATLRHAKRPLTARLRHSD